MTTAQKEKTDAIAQLREWLHPGDTVYTILRHVSRSGMSRDISVVLLACEGSGRISDLHPNYSVAKAIGARLKSGSNDSIVMGGCGMDMGFALVYELSYALFGTGYQCLGTNGERNGCPSNYHSNHHNTIRCEGTMVYNADGPNTGDRCFWSRGIGWVIPCTPDDPAPSQLTDDDQLVKLCPTCKGEGRIDNPEGPERFDLVHTDGYALRHRWL